MNFLVQAILPYILLYKYWGLFVITFLASLAVPIPAGTLLIASAAFASQGYFNLVTLMITVTVASIIGDNTGYWLARTYGKKVLYRVKFLKKILTSKNFNLIETKIRKRPGFIIFITRFEVIATLTANLICGLSEVEYRKFILFEVTGTCAYVIFYGLLGYFFGDSWQAVNDVIGNFSIFFFLAIILGMALFWKRLIHKA